jgi:D-beta-D-heptose 7-phosphate kinase/D-beta-D-heptose 1-phosphate adenosyltransferase
VSRSPLVVVGDVALDREVIGTADRLCPEAAVPVLEESKVLDRPGGAGLAALFARSPDREVVLVTALGADSAGDRVRGLLRAAGVRLVELDLLGPTPERIRLRARDQLLLRLDRGGCTEIGTASRAAIDVIRSAGALLVSDRGRGVAEHPAVRAALSERAHGVPLVWHPHPRGGPPVPAARLVTPDRATAQEFVTPAPDAHDQVILATRRSPADTSHEGELAATAGMAVRLRRYWSANAVAVTGPDRGAVLSDGVRPPMLVPVPFRTYGDSAGSGDRFAAAAVAALAGGRTLLDAVTAGVTAVTALVAAGGVLALCPDLFDPATDPALVGAWTTARVGVDSSYSHHPNGRRSSPSYDVC